MTPLKQVCRFCGTETAVPCLSASDMEERFAPRCRAALAREGVEQAAAQTHDRVGMVVAALVVGVIFCLMMYLYTAGYLPNAHR